MALREDKYTQISKKTEQYSDFLNNFDCHPLNGQLIRHTNEDVIKRSIRNLILTNKYERIYNPELGGSIRNLLFEPMTVDTEIALRDAIESTIKNYEKRVDLLDIVVNAFPEDNAYAVSIVFYVTTSNEPLNLDLTLYRVR